MIESFSSYPTVVFKKLLDADTISVFKEKTQFNFEQIYLNYTNKVLTGERGERGYTGLSIKGDKGDKGDGGSQTWFSNVTDGQTTISQDHRENDVIISDIGSFYKVISINGVLKYHLEFVLPTNSLFYTAQEFAGFGAISNHQSFGTGSDSTIVLADRVAGTAKYKKMLLGGNTYVSTSLDTLTLVNLLDSADAAGSTPAKHLTLRYRDQSSGAVSLTGFDFYYNIASNVEYKWLGDGVSNIGLKRDNTTGISNTTLNTNLVYFTSGISNWKLANDTNSLSLKKEGVFWRLRQPSTDTLSLGFFDQLILKDEKVGVGKTPTVPFDVEGDFFLGKSNGSGGYLSNILSTNTSTKFGFGNQYLEISTNLLSMSLSGNQAADVFSISPSIARILYGGNRGINTDPSLTKISFSASSYLELLASSGSLVNSSGSLDISTLYSRLYRAPVNSTNGGGSVSVNSAGIQFQYTKGSTQKTATFDETNGLTIDKIRGNTSLELSPNAASSGSVVKLKNRVAVVNTDLKKLNYSISLSLGLRYVSDLNVDNNTTSSFESIPEASYDRILYVTFSAGIGGSGRVTVDLANVDFSAWITVFDMFGASGSGSIIIPATRRCVIAFNPLATDMTASIVFTKFGVA